MKRTSMHNGTIIRRLELMPLINIIHEKGKRFDIVYPFYNIQIISFTPINHGFLPAGIVSKESFMRARKEHIPKGHFFEFDMPHYSDVKDALILSSMVIYPNIRQVHNALLEIIQRERKSPRLTFLGIDTNIAYLRFFSRNFPAYKNGYPILAERYRYVISDIVRREIDEAIKDKYRGEHIRKMREHLAHSHLLSGFYNAATKTSRRAKDANVEIYILKNIYGAMKAQTTEYSSDKEERDILIARSYASFQRDENVEVILFTADEDMVDHAISVDLDYMFIKYPHEMKVKNPVEAKELCNLLYSMAVRMGASYLPDFGVEIIGEWSGKNTDNYRREEIMIFFNDKKLEMEFLKAVKVSRRLLDVLGQQYVGGHRYGALMVG